ncbi:MAG: helix-turn-helix domain-containing protein [Acidimicrobiales bacterium]|nr:helix-turn-helix domain-containing protein [Acidimicrobiales bacterium]
MPKQPPTRTPSRWNGLTTEERQRERRQLLIDAAFDLLAAEGSSGTTVRAVCAAARLNPRYFYESFDGLDELVVAVYDHVIDLLHIDVVRAVNEAGDDPVEAVRAVVTTLVDFVDGDRRMGRVLYVEALGNEALNVRRMQTGFDLVDILQQDVERRRGTKGAQQLERLAAAMLVGGSSEVLAAWLDGRIDMTRDELVEDMTQLFLAVGERTARLSSKRIRS